MRLEDGLWTLSRRLAVVGALIGAREIAPGDEASFVDPSQESTAINLDRRRASGAARIAAAGLIGQMGIAGGTSIGRMPNGAPRWPDGVLGSIAHDRRHALALVARAGGAIRSLGVDIEDAAPLPEDIFEFVLSPPERIFCAKGGLAGRVAFAAKEAVYKAINPLEGTPLEYRDIGLATDMSWARLADGRRLSLAWIDVPAIVVVAMLAT